MWNYRTKRANSDQKILEQLSEYRRFNSHKNTEKTFSSHSNSKKGGDGNRIRAVTGLDPQCCDSNDEGDAPTQPSFTVDCDNEYVLDGEVKVPEPKCRHPIDQRENIRPKTVPATFEMRLMTFFVVILGGWLSSNLWGTSNFHTQLLISMKCNISITNSHILHDFLYFQSLSVAQWQRRSRADVYR